MSEDFDQKRPDKEGSTGGGGRAEDPLIELARIVHNNKQTGAPVNSGRVGSTDYFAALDDFNTDNSAAPEPASERVEPSFGGAPAQPTAPGGNIYEAAPVETATNRPASSPAAFAGGADALRTTGFSENSDIVRTIQQPDWPEVPSLESIENAAAEALNRPPVSGVRPDVSVQTPQPAPATPSLGGQSRVAVQPTVSDGLEQNLTAELEDELIGALRQSVDNPPSVQGDFEPAPSAVPTPVAAVSEISETPRVEVRSPAPAAAPEPGAAQNGPVDTATRPGTNAWGSEPISATRDDRQSLVGLPSGGSLSAEPRAVDGVGSAADAPRPAINEDDLFAALTLPQTPAAGANTRAGSGDNVTGLDTLLADLDFPDPATRGENPQAAEPVSDPLAASASGQNGPEPGSDIDDMSWPAAASAVPKLDEDETPPPPGGYDLDAVARAMQESDPTLKGAGVLPPHSDAEQAAVPHAEERSRRGVFVAAGVLGLAVVGAAGFFFLDGGSPTVPDGPPPVISGLQDPLKILPETTSSAGDDQSAKLIYDRVDGLSENTPENLPVRETPEPASLPPAPANAESGAELVPGATRRVRTVVVRPDGTIVSAADDPSTSGPAPLPASPETAPRVVQTTPITSGSGTATAPTPANPVAVTTSPVTVTTTAVDLAPAPAPVTAQPAPATVEPAPATPQPSIVTSETPTIVTPAPETVEAPVSDTPAIAVPSVVPLKKPQAPVRVAQAPAAQAPAAVAPARTNDGPLNLTQAAAPAAPAATSGGGSIPAGTYIVQVTSQRSAAAAQNAYAGLQGRYPSILGNRNAVIVSANLGDRGTFYRARIPTGSRDEAVRLCEQLQGAGGDCFVRRSP